MKLKTNKTASKRISAITQSGILLRRRVSAQHLVRNKARRVRKLAKRKLHISAADIKQIRRLLPYWKMHG